MAHGGGAADADATQVDDYLLGRTIGSGQYGKVRLGTHVTSGREVAVKIIRKKKVANKDAEMMRREMQIQQLLVHPNIVRVHSVVDQPSRLYVICEYCSGGEIFDHLVAHQRLREPEVRRVFRRLISAMDYCHSLGFVHRDLKLENILLDADLNPKIADFGFSRLYDPQAFLNTSCGSPLYAAPEILMGHEYHGPEVDVWCLGVILFALAVGAMPYPHDNPAVLREVFRRGERFPDSEYLSDGLRALLSRMLEIDRMKRISMAEILAHAWVNVDAEPMVPHRPIICSTDNPEPEIVARIVDMGLDRGHVLAQLAEHRGNTATVLYELIRVQRESKAKQTAKRPATPEAPAAPAHRSRRQSMPFLSTQAGSPLSKAAPAPTGGALPQVIPPARDRRSVELPPKTELFASPSRKEVAARRLSAGAGSPKKQAVIPDVHVTTENDEHVTGGATPTASANSPPNRSITAPINITAPVIRSPSPAPLGSSPRAGVRIDPIPSPSARSTKPAHNNMGEALNSSMPELPARTATLSSTTLNSSDTVIMMGSMTMTTVTPLTLMSDNDDRAAQTQQQPLSQQQSVARRRGSLEVRTGRLRSKSLEGGAQLEDVPPPEAGRSRVGGRRLGSTGSDSSTTTRPDPVELSSSVPTGSGLTPQPPSNPRPATPRKPLRSIHEDAVDDAPLGATPGLRMTLGSSPPTTHASTSSRGSSRRSSLSGSVHELPPIAAAHPGPRRRSSSENSEQSHAGGPAGAGAGAPPPESLQPRAVRTAINAATTSSLPPREMLATIQRVLLADGVAHETEAYTVTASFNLGQTTAVRMELEVCRTPQLSLNCVRMRRLIGDVWEYQRLCTALVGKLRFNSA